MSDRSQRGKLLPFPRAQTDSAPMSDDALLAACAVGEAAALASLFDRHREVVARVLSRIVGSSSCEIDDLVQTTYLELWRSASKYRGRSAVRTWLLGIAANIARHHVRSEVRRRTALDDFATNPTQNAKRPDDEVARQQLVGLVGDALETLPHDLRVAFVLCDLEGVAGVDAARALGVRQGTMWRRLHDARKRLRAAIEVGRPS